MRCNRGVRERLSRRARSSQRSILRRYRIRLKAGTVVKGTNGSLQKDECYLRLNLLLDAQLVAIDRNYQFAGKVWCRK